MKIPARSARLAVGLAVSVAAACGPTTPASSIPAATTPTATASLVAPTSTPTPSALELRDAGSSPLPQGRYTSADFEPEITIELDRDWQAASVREGYFAVSYVPHDPHTLVQFARPTGIYGNNSLTLPTSAEAAVAELQANPSLDVIETSESRVGGLTGLQITIETPLTATSPTRVLAVAQTGVLLLAGRRMWIAFFETPQGVIAVMVTGTATNWDEALAAAEPVLESVTIGR